MWLPDIHIYITSWYAQIHNCGQSMCFGRATQKQKSHSFKNSDNYKKGNLGQLIVVRVAVGHRTELRTWNLISQASLWHLMFSPQKYQLWPIRLCKKLFQLSTHIPTSVFAIWTGKNLNIVWVCFLNLHWRADIVIKLLKSVFPYMAN